MAEEERYILMDAAELLGVARGTLMNWIDRAGFSEIVDQQIDTADLRARYLTRSQVEQLAKAHRRRIAWPQHEPAESFARSLFVHSDAEADYLQWLQQQGKTPAPQTGAASLASAPTGPQTSMQAPEARADSTALARIDELTMLVKQFAIFLTGEMVLYVNERLKSLGSGETVGTIIDGGERGRPIDRSILKEHMIEPGEKR